MRRRTARTHGDAGTSELLADRAQMNAQLSTDLAEGPGPGRTSGPHAQRPPRHGNGAVHKDVVRGPSYRLRRIGPADSLALKVRCSG